MGSVSNLQTFTLIFSMEADKKIRNYMEEFKAISFPKDKPFPLKLHRRDEIELGFNGANDDKINGSASKQNPKAINDKLNDLVYMMHGSFESKTKITEDFNVKFPECSKKSIEKKMRDLFVKEKKGQDPKARWYATESTLVELNLTDDQQL